MIASPGQAHVAAGPADRGDDLAGRDPDADLHGLATVRDLVQAGPDRHRRERRANGVVVVARGPAEHREDRVADELLAGALVLHDRLAHRGQCGGHPRAHLLGIVLGDHPHVVHEVGEERRHDPPVAGVR